MMAKVVDPLLSVSASGRVGRMMIHRRGGVVTKYHTPKNTNSILQMEHRAAFKAYYMSSLTQAQADLLYAAIIHEHDDLYSLLAHGHDHGALSGLADDDHTQYLNQTRGDGRYSLLAHTHSASGIAENGWVSITLGSPTRTAATTFTTTTDLTSTWQKGHKLKFTDTTTKYAYVVALSAYSAGSMTITIAGDSLVGNPSAFSYSPIESPLGFPVSFTYTQSYTGFSVNPTQTCSYSIIGTRLFMVIATTSDGTSNATGFTMSLPVVVNGNVIIFANVTDNGAQKNGIAYAAGTTTTLTYYAGVFGTTFANTGTKGGSCALSYLI